MTVINYRATTLLLRFAELVKECNGFLTCAQQQELNRIRELVRSYAAEHFLVELTQRISLTEGSPLMRFVDLLRADVLFHYNSLAIKDPGYWGLHRIADACVAWAKDLGVDLLAERVKPLMKLHKPPMREPE